MCTTHPTRLMAATRATLFQRSVKDAQAPLQKLSPRIAVRMSPFLEILSKQHSRHANAHCRQHMMHARVYFTTVLVSPIDSALA